MKVFIVDDHPLVKRGLYSVLSLEDDIEVCGDASNVEDAVKSILDINPDIALIDLRLSSNEDGLDIVKMLKEKGHKCKIVIFTSSCVVEDVIKAEEVGINGYILKQALPEELIYALRLVYKGRKYYDPSLYEIRLKEEENPIDELTPREMDVLVALGSGLSNRDIAKKLYISEYTVKKHVSQILSKLNLSDRTQAALYINSKKIMPMGH